MSLQTTIRRNLVLKEMEARETPSGQLRFFSIKFVKLDGELIFIPRATTCGLRFKSGAFRKRGIQPLDEQNKPMGHPVTIDIDSLIEFNSLKVIL